MESSRPSRLPGRPPFAPQYHFGSVRVLRDNLALPPADSRSAPGSSPPPFRPPSKGFVLRRPSYRVVSICLESLSHRLFVCHGPIATARPPEGARSFASLDAFVRAPRPSRQHRPSSVYRFLSSVASLPSSDEIVSYVTDRNRFPGISGSAVGQRLRYLRPPFCVLPQSRSSPTAKADHRFLNKHAVILNRRSSLHQLQITV